MIRRTEAQCTVSHYDTMTVMDFDDGQPTIVASTEGENMLTVVLSTEDAYRLGHALIVAASKERTESE